MARRIVICSDGTWNRPDNPTQTNVVKVRDSVPATGPDGVAQLVFYDPGVGTSPGLEKITGGMFGHGLDENVMDNYRYLATNYQPGDELFLFGFSRGAFTVRSTVGLIRKCGILTKPDESLIRDAYRIYRLTEKPPPGATWKPADSPTAEAFRNSYSHPREKIRFLGVWDTVGSLGIPGRLRGLTAGKYKFHDVELSSWVIGAYQALAVDEHRQPFEPAIWQTKPVDGQEVEQAWFPGAHSDVGGGYQQAGLSDQAFLWMVERAQRHGLVFDNAYLESRIHADYSGKLHDSMDWYYRIFGNGDRTINDATHQPQSIDDHTRERYFDDALNYKPANLKPVLEP
jgi:uncharacterized protein (DUF2235 family)